MLTSKIGIIGAGNVGMRYAYSLIIHGLARSIVIVDMNKTRAEGDVLDLASGMPYLSPVEIKAGDYRDLSGCDMVVITAGAKQKPGQSRMDLIKENTEIFKNIIPKITQYAKSAVFVVVANPVDILAWVAFKLSGKPWNEVISSGTVLDSARLRFLLSQHCGVDARNIHAYILGEHGDSEFAAWSKATIGGEFLKDRCLVCKKCNRQEELKKIFVDVRDYASKVIERKGETSYGIGLALSRITEAIIKDENSVLPVSCLVQDYYGISDIFMSLPAVVNKKGVREVLKIQLDEEEQKNLHISADVIKTAIKETRL